MKKYLAEYAENALLALELAAKEAEYLRYTYQTLYSEKIDLDWVVALNNRSDLAEKIDAFVSRFGRLQDHIGEKLLPRFAALLGENPKSTLDTLAYAERMGWIENADNFFGARKLRNLLVHECLSDPALFLEALNSAKASTEMLLDVVKKLSNFATHICLNANSNHAPN